MKFLRPLRRCLPLCIMDEAFRDDTIWIWGTCFMTLFCKYAPAEFPGVESLNNFVEWRLRHPGEQGLCNLHFGAIRTDVVYDGNGTVRVTSNAPYTLDINGTKHDIIAGDNVIRIDPAGLPTTTGLLRQ